MSDVVTLAQIAQFARVRRPTVSNWRRRHSDFPPPLNPDSGQPVFDAAEVAAWLDTRPGEYGQAFRANRLGGATIAEAIDPDAYAEAGLALIATRRAYGRPLPDDVASLRELAGQVEGLDPQLLPEAEFLPPLRNEVERLVEAYGPGGAAEALLAAAARQGWSAAAAQTPAEIGELVLGLVSELLGEPAELTIADLAAGPGGFLATVPAGGQPVRYAEADPTRHRLLRLRLLCHGHPVAAAEPTSAEVVFADPPFQPGERASASDHPMTWATRVIDKLHEDGLGFLVVPEWTLTRGAIVTPLPVQRFRSELIRQGRLWGIIQLPRRVHPYLGGADLALLILARDGMSTPDVLVCDAEQVRARAGTDWVRRTVQLVTGSPSSRDPRLCQAFAAAGMRDARSLLPAHLLTPVAPAADHLVGAVNARATAIRLSREATDPADLLERVEIAQYRGGVGHRTLGELIRPGQLRRLVGHRIPEAEFGTVGQRVLGAEELVGALPLGSRRIDLAALAHYPATTVTEPGDLILLVDDRLRVLVDDSGGSVLVTPVQGLRIPGYHRHITTARDEPQQPWIKPYALAALLDTDRNRARVAGRLRRSSLEALEIPLLPATDYEQLNDAARELTELAEQARQRAAALVQVRERIATGLAAGALKLRVKPAT